MRAERVHPWEPMSPDDPMFHIIKEGRCGVCARAPDHYVHDMTRLLTCTGLEVDHDGTPYGEPCREWEQRRADVDWRTRRTVVEDVAAFRTRLRVAGWRIGRNQDGEVVASCPACSTPTAEHRANLAAIRKMIR